MDGPWYIKSYEEDRGYLSDAPEELMDLFFRLQWYARDAKTGRGMSIKVWDNIKLAICRQIGLETKNELESMIYKLIVGHVLIYLCKDYYQINPWLFGIGEWEDIERLRCDVPHRLIEGKTFAKVLEDAERMAQKGAQKDENPKAGESS